MAPRASRVFLFAALLAGSWSLRPARAQEAADEYEARLTEVKGEVTVFTSEEPDGVPGDQDMPLAAGDRVKTAADASAEVTLSGEHCVLLRAGSELAVTSVKRSRCVLTLALGSLLAKIQTLAGGGFQVQTPAAVASVRGTEFGVEVDAAQPDQTHVGVFDEGKVEVSGQTGQPELLKSNQETSVRRGARPLAAYQLRRFARHRQFMRAFRKRAQAVRNGWRALGLQARLGKRREMLQRLRQVREQRLEKARQKAQQKLRGRKGSKALRPDQEKMEKRKKAIRERLRRPGN
ncbi:MAG: FecR domain-containing protein [Elusimicrobia bacterium]|nr:FecR domain-containing protein [Elusimicrobiota bacterium]